MSEQENQVMQDNIFKAQVYIAKNVSDSNTSSIVSPDIPKNDLDLLTNMVYSKPYDNLSKFEKFILLSMIIVNQEQMLEIDLIYNKTFPGNSEIEKIEKEGN